MAKIVFPKITQPLDLGDYAEALAGQQFTVWVNPPEKLRRQYFTDLQNVLGARDDLAAAWRVLADAPDDQTAKNQHADALNRMETLTAAMLEIISQLLSQGAEPVSVDDLKEMIAASEETDPAFYGWLAGRVWGMVADHRTNAKKK